MTATTLFSSTLHALTATSITISNGGETASSTAAGPKEARTLSPSFGALPVYAEFIINAANATTGNDAVGLRFSYPSVLGIAVTIASGMVSVWATLDGVNWNGSGTPNPATGVGANIYNASGPVFAGVSSFTDQNPVTFNFGQAAFTHSIPAGFSAWSATETIGTLGTGLVPGPDNVTVYPTQSSTWASALSANGKASGSFYLEVSLAGNSSNGAMLGFGDASTNLNNFLGSDGHSCGMQNEGDVYGFSSHTGNPGFGGSGVESPSTTGNFYYASDGNIEGVSITAPTWTTGATIGLAWNGSALWWTLDGATWNGSGTSSPVTGVDGAVTPGGAAQLAVTFNLSGSEITLNTTGPFTHSVPTGYYAWDGGAPPAPVAQLPTPNRRAADYAQHHSPKPFAGRAPRRVAVISTAPIIPPAPAPAGRFQMMQAQHFKHEGYPGRAPKKVALAPPPVIVPPIPSRAVASHLRTHATHFARPSFEGRRLLRHDFNYGGGVGIPARASQIVAETLIQNPAGARASQVILEALMQDPATVRASLVSIEALYSQNNPAFVRAGQVVLEVLVPYTEMPVVPVYPALVGLTFDYVKRPKWSTGVGQVTSGREIRVGYWSLPQWEWDLSYDILADTSQNVGTTASDIKTLIGFVLSQFGAQAPFYFQDPDDNAVTGQVIGTGDGTTTTFQFVRTYGQDSGLGNFNGTEPIGGLNLEETLAVYVNGVVQESGITINNSTPCYNTVQFAVAPAAGQVVTADFSFYYFCRLREDSLDFNKFMSGLWNTKKLSIFSLKG